MIAQAVAAPRALRIGRHDAIAIGVLIAPQAVAADAIAIVYDMPISALRAH